jgi:hypothetical protein
MAKIIDKIWNSYSDVLVGGGSVLISYKDADIVGDFDSRKSNYGYIMTFAWEEMSWQLRLYNCASKELKPIMQKSGLIKLIGFLKSSSLTHLLNELGRAELLVGRVIGPWRAAWPIPTHTRVDENIPTRVEP